VPGGRFWGEAHEVLANLMLAAIAAHVLAALWHQFVLRDRAISRMVRG
jgi:cytochrome b561